MSNTIPLSKDFNVTTNAVSPAGTGVVANGLMLTTNASVQPEAITYAYQLSDVTSVFGSASQEATCAAVYFDGFENSGVLPGTLLIGGISSINNATRGSLISNDLSDVVPTTIQAIPAGTMTVLVDGVSQTSASIDPATFTDFASFTQVFQAAITGVTVQWNSAASRYYIYSTTYGASSSVVIQGGTIADALRLSPGGGAQSFPGTDSESLTDLMNAFLNKTENWVAFACAQELTTAQKTELALWANNSNNRYTYCFADNSAAAVTANSTTAFLPAVVTANNYSSCFGMYGLPQYAFAPLAYCASLDYSATNGRLTFKFRNFSGLAANVSDLTTAKALETNGYSYQGSYSQNAVMGTYSGPGNISGAFDWIDSWIDQVVIKADIISAYYTLFSNNQSYAFNATGYASIQAAMIDVATKHLNYGSIQKGVTLDSSQTAIIKNAVGKDITQQLYSDGWYFYIPTQSGANRIARDLTGCVFYYVDGQMIQTINLTSTAVL